MSIWYNLRNTFLIITKFSLKRAVDISTWHDSILNSNKDDPFILVLYNAFHLVHLRLLTAYDKWITTIGKQKSKTQILEGLFEQLMSEKIDDWDVKIQGVYKKSSPEYTLLLPNRRIPFQSGKANDRLEAVRGLSTAIGTDAALTEVKADVDAFYAKIIAAQTEQKGVRGEVKLVSKAAEAVRVEMCNLMYANLGALMQKYPSNPEITETFFDVNTISKAEQSIFTGTIKPLEMKTVVKRTFNAGDEVILTNTTNATLKFYLAKLKGDQPGTKFVELPKGEQVINAEQLGNISDSFLMVVNTNGDILGKYEVEIV